MPQPSIVTQDFHRLTEGSISRRVLLAGSAGLITAASLAMRSALAQGTPSPGMPAVQAPIRQNWLDKRHEEIIEPELPIIDPHHHLWDRPNYRYLFPELLADVGSGHNIRATCIIGFVDLQLGSRAKGVLERHIAVSDGRLRGIRNGSTWSDDPTLKTFTAGGPKGLLLDKNFREGFAALAPLGLAFDGWMFQTQLDDLVDLARAFPQTTIVLNHVGGPLAIGPYAGKREEAFTEWRDRIRKIALLPNTYVKLGGLGMKMIGFTFYENPDPPSSQDLEQAWQPYIETCIEAFGPQRSMFESNFPVDKGTCSYQVLWNTFKRIAASYSAGEKTALFSGTAAKAYGLTL